MNSNQYKSVKLYVPILVPTSYDGKILENKKKKMISSDLLQEKLSLVRSRQW